MLAVSFCVQNKGSHAEPLTDLVRGLTLQGAGFLPSPGVLGGQAGNRCPSWAKLLQCLLAVSCFPAWLLLRGMCSVQRFCWEPGLWEASAPCAWGVGFERCDSEKTQPRFKAVSFSIFQTVLCLTAYLYSFLHKFLVL